MKGNCDSSNNFANPQIIFRYMQPLYMKWKYVFNSPVAHIINDKEKSDEM